MRRLLVLAALTACPAAPSRTAERPLPPPAQVDAAPRPRAPAVVAVRADGRALELVHIDASGETRVLHVLRRAAGLASVVDLAVDPETGRYAVLVEADSVDATPVSTPRDVRSLVLGRLDGGTVAIAPGDTSCVAHRCFEAAVAIAPGGDTLVTTLHRSRASELARYEFVAAPRPTRLVGAVEKPVVSADHARIAYQQGRSLYVADLAGGSPAPVTTGTTDVAALALDDGVLVYRTRAGAVEIVDVATGTTRTAARLAPDPRPTLRVAGGTIVTGDGERVVAVPLDGGEPRAIATGALIDVSADGAWVLVDDGALAVIAVADGQVAARHEVEPPLGQVRARLAP